MRSWKCPLGCSYSDPIPACVRLHLIQHHDCTYEEAQNLYPDNEE